MGSEGWTTLARLSSQDLERGDRGDLSARGEDGDRRTRAAAAHIFCFFAGRSSSEGYDATVPSACSEERWLLASSSPCRCSPSPEPFDALRSFASDARPPSPRAAGMFFFFLRSSWSSASPEEVEGSVSGVMISGTLEPLETSRRMSGILTHRIMLFRLSTSHLTPNSRRLVLERLVLLRVPGNHCFLNLASTRSSICRGGSRSF
mmetsp:Transcript_407/g.694  ORF Transcript_407/g.694 Transcript_407/m.694 type:complete len:205 (-) Transcript_407:2844-3458(-)